MASKSSRELQHFLLLCAEPRAAGKLAVSGRRGLSPFDALRMSVDPAYEIGKCSTVVFQGFPNHASNLCGGPDARTMPRIPATMDRIRTSAQTKTYGSGSSLIAGSTVPNRSTQVNVLRDVGHQIEGWRVG